MSSPQVFNEADKFKCRLWKTCDVVVRAVMFQILLWVNQDWDQTTPFKEYLKNKIDEEQFKKFEKGLFKYQKVALDQDPIGKEWDTTLIYTLLRYCGGLAGRDDTAWSSITTVTTESILTSLKNFRNALAHEIVDLDKTGFFNKTEDIRSFIKDVLVSAGVRCPHVTQTEIVSSIDKFNKSINDIRDASFIPESYVAYENELFYSQLIQLMRLKGLPVLIDHLKKMTSVSPLSFIVQVDMLLPVTDIFTEMMLEKDQGKVKVFLENVIGFASSINPGEFTLLKGHAGIGKTTIVKKITSDWYNGIGAIKGLTSFGLVLYAELRDRIESFEDLLRLSLGDVHTSFSGRVIVNVALSQNCLVILDGYDEINTSSLKLFQDILTLNKFHNKLTVLVTTRPEAEEKLVKQLESADVKAVHVCLIGIEASQRAAFVEKYFSNLTKVSSSSQQVLDELKSYLNKTQDKMSEVWKLPYNLAMLTILWIFRPDDVNRITTEAELYWEMNKCIKSKLEDRLQRSEVTGHLSSSVVSSKISRFFEELCRLSLNALKENELHISEHIYNEMTIACCKLEVSVEELAGAFLKKITTSKDTRYCFPHKGNQEFIGAYSIYLQVTGECYDEQKEIWTKELLQTSIPQHFHSIMLNCIKEQLKPTISKIFEDLHCGSFPESMEKYQNLLIQFLSIIHVSGTEVQNKTKEEALNLLEKSGLKDKFSWLKILNNLKCDDFTAKWIAEKQELFTESTIVNDFSFEPYIALLKAIEPPLKNNWKVNIRIQLKQASPVMDEIAKEIERHDISVVVLNLDDHYYNSKENISSIDETAIQTLLQEKCEEYKGMWSPKFHLYQAMRDLCVRLHDKTAMEAFFKSLSQSSNTTLRKIETLKIRFSAKLNKGIIVRPIPVWIEDTSLFIEDIEKEEEAHIAGDILRGLLPQTGSFRAFDIIHFPRCSLNSEKEISKLLDCLQGIGVRFAIYLPQEIQPSDDSDKFLYHKAKQILECNSGIIWKPESFFWQ